MSQSCAEEWRPWRLRFSTAPSARQTPETAGTRESEEETSQYPSHVDVYPTQNVAALWNFVEIARLHVLRAMLLLIEIEDSALVVSGQKCIPSPDTLRDDMRSTIENIFATVPFVSLVDIFVTMLEEMTCHKFFAKAFRFWNGIADCVVTYSYWATLTILANCA